MPTELAHTAHRPHDGATTGRTAERPAAPQG